MHQRLRTTLLILAVAATGLAAAFACGCGGSSPAPSGSPVATTSLPPKATPSPPVSTTAPLLDLGGSASFALPGGSSVTVAADEFTDTIEDKLTADAHVVSLKLGVRAEAPDAASGETVALAFKESSFLLVAADDSLYTPAAIAEELAAGRWKPGESTGFNLTFVVRDSAELVRFVCTPGGTVTPRSATWLLK